MSWKKILKMPTDDPDEWLEQRGDFMNSFMLTDKTWNEAGGQIKRNLYTRDEEPIPEEEAKEGFRFASIDEIEKILGRELTVDDFSVSQNNWMRQEGAVFNKIGLEGQKELAERYLRYTKKHTKFPTRRRIDGKPITYNNMNELLDDDGKIHIALELVGHMKGLDILGV